MKRKLYVTATAVMTALSMVACSSQQCACHGRGDKGTGRRYKGSGEYAGDRSRRDRRCFYPGGMGGSCKRAV